MECGRFVCPEVLTRTLHVKFRFCRKCLHPLVQCNLEFKFSFFCRKFVGFVMFLVMKFCPVLYLPVAGNVMEICKFHVVLSSRVTWCPQYVFGTNPTSGNATFLAVGGSFW